MEQKPKESPWPPATDLVERAQAGEHAAFIALYQLIRPRLLSFLSYQGFPQPTADDLVAAIMETVLQKIGTLRKAQAFEAWFWTLTRNHVRGHLRAQKRFARLAPMQSPTAAPPEETVLLHEEHQAIRTALATLSAADRELLWLREVEQLSYRDIGGRLGAASGAARVRCHRARQRLQDAYRIAVGGEN